jgi:hypothetical protein
MYPGKKNGNKTSLQSVTRWWKQSARQMKPLTNAVNDGSNAHEGVP